MTEKDIGTPLQAGALPTLLTVTVGTYYAVIAFPHPWPVDRFIIVKFMELADGFLGVFFDPFGRIWAKLLDKDKNLLRIVMSCILDVEYIGVVSIFVVWSNDELRIDIGSAGKVISIGSTDPKPDIPLRLFIPRRVVKNTKDFSVESASKLMWRRDKLAGTHPKRGTIRADKGFVFGELHASLLEMRDLLRLIEEGRIHHLSGLTNLLRKVIVTGEPLPLLQLCAAIVNAPLMVFTAGNPGHTLRGPLYVRPATFRIAFNGSATPTPLLTNPVDLDIWLDLGAVEMESHLFTNRDQLRVIGNTTGAHFDIDIHPSVAMARRQTSSLERQNETSLTKYILDVTVMIGVLIERLLSENGYQC